LGGFTPLAPFQPSLGIVPAQGFRFPRFYFYSWVFITSLARRFLVGQKEKNYAGMAFDECTAHERFFLVWLAKIAVVYPKAAGWLAENS
jgi:hypothetical protein